MENVPAICSPIALPIIWAAEMIFSSATLMMMGARFLDSSQEPHHLDAILSRHDEIQHDHRRIDLLKNCIALQLRQRRDLVAACFSGSRHDHREDTVVIDQKETIFRHRGTEQGRRDLGGSGAALQLPDNLDDALPEPVSGNLTVFE